MMDNLLNRITSSPDICFWQTGNTSTRMAVVFLMEHVAAGDTVEEILKAFPFLEKEDILACLQYTMQLIDRTIQLLKKSIYQLHDISRRC